MSRSAPRPPTYARYASRCDSDYRHVTPGVIDIDVSTDDPKSEQQALNLALARRENEQLAAEQAELKVIIARQRKALDAARAERARLLALCEQQPPIGPERVAPAERRRVLQGTPGAFTAQPEAANDAPAPAEASATASDTSSRTIE